MLLDENDVYDAGIKALDEYMSDPPDSGFTYDFGY